MAYLFVSINLSTPTKSFHQPFSPETLEFPVSEWFITIKGKFLDNETIPIYFFPRLIQYTIWLIKEIFISNITTAKVILSKSEEPELFSVKATQKTNEGKVTYANSITLTPGTVTTQIKDNVFEVHALTKEFGDDVRSSEMDRMVTWLEKGK